MPNFRSFIPLLFFPAGIGIALRVALAPSLPERLLAVTLLLLCLELTHMAKVDFDNIASVKAFYLSDGVSSDGESSDDTPSNNTPATSDRPNFPLPTSGQTTETEDSRLISFRNIVDSTVALELLGFYGALPSLQWGGIVIILSQLWFNLLAKIQLWPQAVPMITSCGLRERLPVLAANAVALAVIALWFIQGIRLWLAVALLILICLFLIIKYAVPIFHSTDEHSPQRFRE